MRSQSFGVTTHRGFFFHTSTSASPTLYRVLLDFLNLVINAIICLVTVIDCQTSLTRGVRRNAGTVVGAVLDRCLSVKQQKETPCTCQYKMLEVSDL